MPPSPSKSISPKAVIAADELNIIVLSDAVSLTNWHVENTGAHSECTPSRVSRVIPVNEYLFTNSQHGIL